MESLKKAVASSRCQGLELWRFVPQLGEAHACYDMMVNDHYILTFAVGMGLEKCMANAENMYDHAVRSREAGTKLRGYNKQIVRALGSKGGSTEF